MALIFDAVTDASTFTCPIGPSDATVDPITATSDPGIFVAASTPGGITSLSAGDRHVSVVVQVHRNFVWLSCTVRCCCCVTKNEPKNLDSAIIHSSAAFFIFIRHKHINQSINFGRRGRTNHVGGSVGSGNNSSRKASIGSPASLA